MNGLWPTGTLGATHLDIITQFVHTEDGLFAQSKLKKNIIGRPHIFLGGWAFGFIKNKDDKANGQPPFPCLPQTERDWPGKMK